MEADVQDDSAETGDTNELPPLVWEIVALRTRLPESLCSYLGFDVATLRVSHTVDRKIRSAHTEDVPYYEQLEMLLPEWKHAIPDPKSIATWQIYIPLTDAHWLAVIVGKDRNDSINLVSVFRMRTRNVRSRIRGLVT